LQAEPFLENPEKIDAMEALFRMAGLRGRDAGDFIKRL
jgi:hypothetical protein